VSRGPGKAPPGRIWCLTIPLLLLQMSCTVPGAPTGNQSLFSAQHPGARPRTAAADRAQFATQASSPTASASRVLMNLFQVPLDRRLWGVCLPDPLQQQQARPLRSRRRTQVCVWSMHTHSPRAASALDAFQGRNKLPLLFSCYLCTPCLCSPARVCAHTGCCSRQ
jgi:hypothetical protein